MIPQKPVTNNYVRFLGKIIAIPESLCMITPTQRRSCQDARSVTCSELWVFLILQNHSFEGPFPAWGPHPQASTETLKQVQEGLKSTEHKIMFFFSEGISIRPQIRNTCTVMFIIQSTI